MRRTSWHLWAVCLLTTLLAWGAGTRSDAQVEGTSDDATTHHPHTTEAPPTAGTRPATKPATQPKPALFIPKGVRVVKDLRYVPGPASEKAQSLDLYVPQKASATPLPVIVFIHGGSWIAGDKTGIQRLEWVLDGYAMVSINYRFSNKAQMPAQLYDCKAAIRFIRANAASYNLDPNRIGVWGQSAGGHLAAMVGVTGGLKVLEGDLGNLDQSSGVQAVVDWYGPTDFTTMKAQALPKTKIDRDSPKCPEARLIGGAIPANLDKARAACPMAYVSAKAPPFLIMHGDKDTTVPPMQSQELYDALRKLDCDAKLVMVPGAGHGIGRKSTYDEVKRFFDERLKNAPATKLTRATPALPDNTR